MLQSEKKSSQFGLQIKLHRLTYTVAHRTPDACKAGSQPDEQIEFMFTNIVLSRQFVVRVHEHMLPVVARSRCIYFVNEKLRESRL